MGFLKIILSTAELYIYNIYIRVKSFIIQKKISHQSLELNLRDQPLYNPSHEKCVGGRGENPPLFRGLPDLPQSLIKYLESLFTMFCKGSNRNNGRKRAEKKDYGGDVM